MKSQQVPMRTRLVGPEKRAIIFLEMRFGMKIAKNIFDHWFDFVFNYPVQHGQWEV